MKKIPPELTPILEYLVDRRGLDFSGVHPDMLVRRMGYRLEALNCNDFKDYFSFIQENAGEIDLLLNAITINVSRFFRDALTFELLAERILPAILRQKILDRDDSLRIWSAGCAMGEEAYSLAILIQELLLKEGRTMKLHLFGTDIDTRILGKAAKGVYPPSSVENVKYGLLKKYFIRAGKEFLLIPKIKEQVVFSFHDMLDKGHRVPPDSIFGNFDLICCRNLLIYFNTRHQETIFSKLGPALAQNGYLILGEAESPPHSQQDFNRVVEFRPIYQKLQKKGTYAI